MNPVITKLMGIVKQALAESQEDGSDLNPVIAELSKKASLNAEEINRVVEWTNTLKQLKLFKKAEDKTSEFSVADSGEVKKIIYGEDSSVIKQSSDKYNLPDHVNLRNFEKRASVTEANYVKPTLCDYPKVSNELLKQAYASVEQLSQYREEASLEKYAAQDKFVNCLDKIACNLNKHYSESFSEFEQVARDSFGSEALPFLSTLEKMAFANNERLLNYSPKNVIKETENLSLLKEAMDSRNLYQVYSQAEQTTLELEKNWNKRINDYGRRSL